MLDPVRLPEEPHEVHLRTVFLMVMQEGRITPRLLIAMVMKDFADVNFLVHLD